MENRVRTGIGYDVHPYSSDRKLILGGVDIPHDQGLLGHSDADVLAHAIADALLGAAGMGDIGVHFPNTDPALEGISSMIILERVADLLRSRQIRIEWIDAIVIAQRPRIMPFAERMKMNLSRALGISDSILNIKATTTEGLGFEGRGEGVAAQAIATVSVDS